MRFNTAILGVTKQFLGNFGAQLVRSHNVEVGASIGCSIRYLGESYEFH